ncbi:hypothetical protein KIPB_012073 [Kipferlia bialata]|uniref:Uncharacterized protein n=1 Tax=Kipferlia bialata TaxID=797122 RepID=A0A9K3D7C7_9EUKA|nr:hypothetical protein KIPB_012073 [Kipferlia bialata]|eukprot:g12073.t1
MLLPLHHRTWGHNPVEHTGHAQASVCWANDGGQGAGRRGQWTHRNRGSVRGREREGGREGGREGEGE